MKKLILVTVIGISIISCKKHKPDDSTANTTNNTNTTTQTRISFFTRIFNYNWEFKNKFRFDYGRNVNYYVNNQKIPLANIVNENNDSTLQFLAYNIPYHTGDVLSVKFDTATYCTLSLMNNYSIISFDTLNKDGKSWDQKKELASLYFLKSTVGGPNDIPDKSSLFFMCFNKSITCTVP